MFMRIRYCVVLFFLISTSLSFAQVAGRHTPARTIQSTPKSDVFIEGFYWNSTPGGIWWDSLAHLAPRLASAGFSAIWFPPPTKGAAGSLSMGYDIYDQYDVGDYNQKGTVATRFGTRSSLVNAIQSYHNNGMQVFADAVMGHMDGGDQKVPYDCIPTNPPYLPSDSGWLVFNYPTGSGRFKKDATFFYPNQQTCDINQPYHSPDPAYRFGEYLAHAQTKVEDSLIVWGQYMRNVLGFDGFRIDEAKGIDPIFMGPWLQQADTNGYAVAEDYDGIGGIQNWLYWVGSFGGNVSVFDFPLRFDLQSMCDNTPGTWNMNWLDGSGLVNNGTSGYNVATFVDNHDFDRIGWDGSIDIGHSPITTDKMMAYAYILFSEGRPCVWFRDYFMYGLDGKIDTLMWIRQNYEWGGTTKRSGLNPYYVGSSDDQTTQSQYIYVARRDGGNGHPAAYLVLNAHPTEWRGVWVNTNYPNQTFRDFTGQAIDKQAAGDGRVDLWAPPRGYAVYVPDTSLHINFPPFIVQIPDRKAYTNTFFQYQPMFGDPNHDSLALSLSGNPSWMSISSTGLISGTPGINDLAPATVTVNVVDPSGDTATTTFHISIVTHPLMDGLFEGTGVWGQPISFGDTLHGWDTTMAKHLYVTLDSTYVYFGADVHAAQWMTWAFLINTKLGGGSTDSWGRSIVYSHANLPDYVLRGTFGGYAEFHTWNGSAWSGVGTGLPTTELGSSVTSSSLQDGWVEVRIPRVSIGNPSVIDAQFFITGNANTEATFDACPNDQNTTAWSGVTTHLHYYATRGTRTLTQWNLQYPPNATIAVNNSLTIYARTFGFGVTDSAGPGSGVQAWIGYDSVNTNPSSWTNWIPATYNMDINSFDEYKANLGTGLAAGKYFYASRFQYNAGSYLYGGYSATGGGLWDSVHNGSGILNVVGPPGIPTLATPVNFALYQPVSPILSWIPVGNAQTYRLQVAFDSNFTTIVFDDSILTTTSRTVGPLVNDTTYYWRVRSKNIAGISAYSAVQQFQVQQITASFTMQSSWNMISLPMNIYNSRKSAVFPPAISPAFRYNPGGSYAITDSLLVGTGYWLKFPAAETIAVTGYPLTTDSVNVGAGWNMIGAVGLPIQTSSIIQIPGGIVLSQYFSYAGSYQTATTIVPSQSYWVKCSSAGKLVLNAGSSARPVAGMAGMIEKTSVPNFGLLTITDADNHQQILYLGEENSAHINLNMYDMPPLPPAGMFDVRFSSQRDLEVVNEKEMKSIAIQLSSARFPVSISYKTTGSILTMNGMKLTEEPTTVRDSVGSIRLTFAGSASIPKSFALEQNYPNPFNPTTTIRYALPVDAHVQLTIYDILGQKVQTIVDGIQPAGYKSVVWNGANIASGVYMYRLDAVSGSQNVFSQIKKMLIIK